MQYVPRRKIAVVLAMCLLATWTARADSTIDAEVAATLATSADPAFGEYLSGECVTCHKLSGHGEGIPQIIGLPDDAFVRALLEYKAKVRDHQIMTMVAGPLNREELAALAAYFGSLQAQ